MMLKIEIFHNFIMIIGVKGVVLSDKSLFLTLFSIGIKSEMSGAMPPIDLTWSCPHM